MKSRLLFIVLLFVLLVLLVGVIGAYTPQTGGTTTRVSLASDGSQGNSGSSWSSISSDGRYVVFYSLASNLVGNDTNNRDDIFVHDRQTGATTRVSLASDGSQANGVSYNPSISGDGRYVAFWSYASNLVSDDTNGDADIFVHDRQTGATTRVSLASDGSQGNSEARYPSISGDGRYVAFTSDASNLVGDDTNGAWDIFVHDRQTGATTRVSLASDGSQENNHSWYPSISGDGRYVAFESYASNLVSDDTNGEGDVFVHDRQTGVTTRISLASFGAQGNSDARYPSISGDGRYVAFESTASTLVSNDTNYSLDVFIHDRQTKTTTRVSQASDGSQGNYGSQYPSISGDGRYVAFQSTASTLVGNDTNGAEDIFVHDRQTGATTRVSLASDGSQGNAISLYPSISGDGRYVVFNSAASNLVGNDTNGVSDVFVHDRGTGSGAYTISGQITNGIDNPIAGVTITSGTGASATTNATGDYTITGLNAGTYTLVPAKAGYVFTPLSRTVTVPPNATSQDFSKGYATYIPVIIHD